MHPHRQSFKSCALVLGLALFPAIAASFSIYTDRTAWQAALAGATLVEDDFSVDIASAQSIAFDSGVVSTGSTPPASAAVNAVTAGRYTSNNDPDGSGGFPSTTWQFPAQVFAFGMDFVSSANNFGITISGDFDGTGSLSFDTASELGSPGTGFLGIVGNGQFDQIVFTPTANPFDSNEGYEIDNLAFASPAPPAPPVTPAKPRGTGGPILGPVGLVIMSLLLGCLGLGASRRKR